MTQKSNQQENKWLYKDRDFWVGLEYKMSKDIQNGLEGIPKHYWIDGFIPEKLTTYHGGIEIDGDVWLCKGENQYRWSFALWMPQLPEEQLTSHSAYTIQLNEKTKHMAIEMIDAK